MFTFNYKGYGNCNSICGVDIEKLADGRTIVVLTELPENTGTSVTNMVEYLATEIYHSFLKGIPTQNIFWIEHYPERKPFPETFDRVIMTWDGQKFKNPKWERLLPAFFQGLECGWKFN